MDTQGFNKVEAYGKLGFQMPKDLDNGMHSMIICNKIRPKGSPSINNVIDLLAKQE
jgi:hypothetical protein